jgi:glycosyltransferase involved in cell wall biosynthesis
MIATPHTTVWYRESLCALRARAEAGEIGTAQFCLEAANLYLDMSLPLRAECLLRKVEGEHLVHEESLKFRRLHERIAQHAAQQYPRCTCIMIVNNEAAAIAGALDSIDTIMDEIVVCDTGSTDSTAALASRYGIVPVYDAWQNDFSRARNAAIDSAGCDWIFWMDADDRLDESCAEALRGFWRTAAPQGAAFRIVNTRDGAAPVEFIQVRLFPRRASIRFERRVHEQVMHSIARSGIPFSRRPDIIIRHTGYASREAHRLKAARNKPLLIEEYREHPDDPVLRLSFADCLAVLGEEGEAMCLYELTTQDHEAFMINPDAFVQAHCNLAALYYNRGDFHNAKRYYLRSLYLDQTRTEAWYALGRICLHEGDTRKAAGFFMKSARMVPPVRMTAVDTLRIKLESIFHLVQLLTAWERFDEARKILDGAIHCFPNVPQFYTQMGHLLSLRNDPLQSSEWYMKSIRLAPVHNDEAYRGLATLFRRTGDIQTAQSILERTVTTETPLGAVLR